MIEMKGNVDTFPGGASRPIQGSVAWIGLAMLILLAAGSMMIIAADMISDEACNDSEGIPAPNSGTGTRLFLDDAGTSYTFIIEFDLNGNIYADVPETIEETNESGTYEWRAGKSYYYGGHYFRGWDTDKDADGDECLIPSFTSYTFQATGTTTKIKLYAIYDTEYDVTFDANGGTVEGGSTYSCTVKVGGKIENPVATWDDETTTDTVNGGYYVTTHTFEGWYNMETGGSRFGSDGNVYPNTPHQVFYAHWTSETSELTLYKVTFDANGGTCSTESAEGTVSKLPTPRWSNEYDYGDNVITVTRHSFSGWYLDGTTYAGKAGGSFVPTADSTLVARWQTYSTAYYQYTLSYETDGGSTLESDSYESTSDAYTVTIPDKCPDKTGSEFIGWSLTEGGSAEAWPSTTRITLEPGETTLYAVWEERSIGLSGNPSTYAIVGSSWTYRPSTDASGCSFSVSGASWLSATSDGISGTPTAAGAYSIRLTVSCTGYADEWQTFSIIVMSKLAFLSQPSTGGIAYAA